MYFRLIIKNFIIDFQYRRSHEENMIKVYFIRFLIFNEDTHVIYIYLFWFMGDPVNPLKKVVYGGIVAYES